MSEKDTLVVLYYNAGVGHDFDAPVLERGADGKVKVADSTRHPRATAPGKVCAATLQRRPARGGLRERRGNRSGRVHGVVAPHFSRPSSTKP
jgi:hypothetical protein